MVKIRIGGSWEKTVNKRSPKEDATEEAFQKERSVTAWVERDHSGILNLMKEEMDLGI